MVLGRSTTRRIGTGNGLLVSVDRLTTEIIQFGTIGYPEKIARRLRLTNMLNGFLFFAFMLFSVCYAITDWTTLYPEVLVAGLCPLFWLVTPFLHRMNEVAGVAYICVANSIIFLFACYLGGSEFGVHYLLLAAPAALLFLGSDRALVALTLVSGMIGSFIVAEFWMPKAALLVPIPAEISAIHKVICIAWASLIVFGSIYYALRIGEQAELALEREYARSETLLQNLMPDSIAIRLKNNPEEIIADHFDEVTILFADIVDFTPRASRLAPSEVVRFLNGVFSEFDVLVEKHGLEKIKTVGDAYMVAGGMPERRDGHAAAIADMALDMIAVTERLSAEFKEDLSVRIGIDTGPAVAGVIGTRKLFYDVWGDTVNTASRMESHGSAGRIQVTDNARRALGEGYIFERRGPVEVKGKGEMDLYYLTGLSPFA